MWWLAATLAVGLSASAPPAARLLDALRKSGPVGVLADPQLAQMVDDQATQLAKDVPPTYAPAKIPLKGTYQMLFSASKGGSNGKVGPFVGNVTQIILDDKQFLNQVTLFGGLVAVSLRAEREILDDTRIRVSFRETIFKVFGREVKRQPTKGEGVVSARPAGDVGRVGSDSRTPQAADTSFRRQRLIPIPPLGAVEAGVRRIRPRWDGEPPRDADALPLRAPSTRGGLVGHLLP